MRLRRFRTDTDPETGDTTVRRCSRELKHDPQRTDYDPTHRRKRSKGQRAERKRQRQELRGEPAAMLRPTERMSDAERAALRDEVFAAAGRRCQNCGSPWKLTLDHIVPRHLGGGNHRANLQCLCKRCNRAKGLGIWAAQPTPPLFCK